MSHGRSSNRALTEEGSGWELFSSFGLFFFTGRSTKDNEWGYSNRLVDLAVHMSQAPLFGTSICLLRQCVRILIRNLCIPCWKVDGVIPPPAKIESIKARESKRDLMSNGGTYDNRFILECFSRMRVRVRFLQRNLERGWALLLSGDAVLYL